MKIIVSHDVDHLFRSDHTFRDLFYFKYIAKTLIALFKQNVSFKEALLRIISCFKRDRNNIDEIMIFDSLHNVKSTFFFGMNQGLGLSYYPEEAKSVINKLLDHDFLVGVHGINYSEYNGIKDEFETFSELVGIKPIGIRMHYVRYNENTFGYLDKIGYRFDSTEFDKNKGYCIKAPYSINNLWEFPLTIMDVYLSESFEIAKKETVRIIEEARANKCEYISVLFHDTYFDKAYQDRKNWYSWFIELIDNSDEDSFISYFDAIKELENYE